MRRFSGFFVVAILMGGCGATSMTTTDDPDEVSEVPVERGTESGVQTQIEVPGGSGFCDKHDVVLPVRRRAEDIQVCYEAQLKNLPGLSGRVDTTWVIGKDGRVSRVVTTGPEVLGACVAKVIKSIRFRPPLIGCEVISDYPFVFHPE